MDYDLQVRMQCLEMAARLPYNTGSKDIIACAEALYNFAMGKTPQNGPVLKAA